MDLPPRNGKNGKSENPGVRCECEMKYSRFIFNGSEKSVNLSVSPELT